MTRKFFVGGNWKCNGTKASIQALVNDLNKGTFPSDRVEVVVAPTSLHLSFVSENLRKEIQVSAQNCFNEPKGAFTGEISAEMLKDFGLNWVILGHSERRDIFGESSELVGKKVGHALQVGLKVIACVGEHLEEREQGKTFEIISKQLQALLDHSKDWSNVVVAYEPVWAIGTGKTATAQQAQEIHVQIRKWLAQHLSQDVANSTRIIYGGSVNAKNCSELSAQEDIDGFLVGGASLISEDFLKIVNSYSKAQL